VRDVMLLELRFYFMLDNVIGAQNVNIKKEKKPYNNHDIM